MPIIASDICMEFDNEKYVTITYSAVKMKHKEQIKVVQEMSIQSLQPGQHYKYLGIDESVGVENGWWNQKSESKAALQNTT